LDLEEDVEEADAEGTVTGVDVDVAGRDMAEAVAEVREGIERAKQGDL